MLTQKSVIIHIRKVIKEINKSGIHLEKVILYGSFSRNEQQKWSDIDIVLVAREFKGVGPKDARLISKILIRYPDLNIQPRMYNTKDFSPAKDPFVEEILKTGIEIEV